MSALDIAASASLRRDETLEVVLLLAFGDYLDAHTWIIQGVIANARTANLVLLWGYGSMANWMKALHFAPPILAFANLALGIPVIALSVVLLRCEVERSEART
jgi:uncharacterized membrane protein YoaK (UPF0700 family)